MKGKIWKRLIVALAVLVAIALSIFIEHEIFQEKEEEVTLILTVDEAEFSLQDLMYYIWDMEMKVNKMALTYDYKNPGKFWNTYTNGRFTRLRAKDLVIQNATRDEVLYQEAMKGKLSLDEKEEEKVLEKAQELDFEITTYQREITRLTLEDFKEILMRQALGEKYSDYVCEVKGLIEEDLQVEGEYYEKLKENYQIQVQEEKWEKIEMGQVTLQGNDKNR